MSNTSAKVARGSFWLTLSFVLEKGSQFAAQIFLARLLSPADFGIWAMVLIVTTLSALFKDSVISSVLVQRGFEDKKLVNAVYSLSVNISIGMFIVQSLLGYPLSIFFNESILWPLTAVASLSFLATAGAGAHGALLNRQMRFRELAICQSASGFMRFAGLITGASLGLGVWSFAIAEVALAVSDAMLRRHFSRQVFTYSLFPDRDAVKAVQGYIGSLIGINLAVYANTNSDNFLIGKFLGTASLGFYNVAYQLAMLPAFAISQVNRVSFTVLATRDSEGQRAYICKKLGLYALFYAPLYGIAFILAPWLIPFLYGAKWAVAAPIFQIVLVFSYARGFMSILGTALNALDKAHLNAVINWALVPLSVPTFYFGAKWGGTIGVALGVALVLGIAATVWFWIAISRATGWSLKALIEPTVLPTLVTVAGTAATFHLPVPNFLPAVWQAMFFIVLYGLLVSLASGGQIPLMLLNLVKKSLKVSGGV